MKVTGTNIITKNNSGLSKDLFINHSGVKIEIKSTKRGIAISYDGVVVKNGDFITFLPKGVEIYDFEKEI